MNKIRPNEPCWCGSGQKYKKCHRNSDLQGRSESALRPVYGPGRIRPGRISPRRDVPADIPRPDYAATGRPASGHGTHVVRSTEEAERMRRAGRAARQVLEKVMEAVRPGVRTDELDAIAHEECLRLGGYPSPLNYHGYPKSLCTSVNEVICHGIPDDRALEDGDIVNCDVTIFLDGVHGDCSETVLVGEVEDEARRLVSVTRDSLLAGIEQAREEARIRDIGRAIDGVAVPAGFSVVRAFVGHGIGTAFHMDPQVPHYYHHSFREQIQVGMTFTIEPMINQGSWRHLLWEDDWTAVTEDGRLSAQFEHTLLITPRGPEILTLAEGVPQPFLRPA